MPSWFLKTSSRARCPNLACKYTSGTSSTISFSILYFAMKHMSTARNFTNGQIGTEWRSRDSATSPPVYFTLNSLSVNLDETSRKVGVNVGNELLVISQQRLIAVLRCSDYSFIFSSHTFVMNASPRCSRFAICSSVRTNRSTPTGRSKYGKNRRHWSRGPK